MSSSPGNLLSKRDAPGHLSTTVLPPAARLCSNCSTPMEGPFCYQCGQHERHPVRSFGLFVRDILHDVLNLDSRALRTLKPLFFQPGWLTQEYLHGKRERFVPPLRLYVIASLLFFLFIGSSINIDNAIRVQGQLVSRVTESIKKNPGYVLKNKDLIAELEKKAQDSELKTLSEADREAIKQAVAALEAARAQLSLLPDASEELRPLAEIDPVKEPEAYSRAAQKKAQANVAEQLAKLPPEDPRDSAEIDPVKEPEAFKKALAREIEKDREADGDDDRIHFFTTGNGEAKWPFLPQKANDWLTQLNTDLNEKIQIARDEPNRVKVEVLGVLPQSMFIMLPVFALMLKLFYPFARRMYLEHLIVAVHSHSFMFLLLALLIPLGQFSEAIDRKIPWVSDLLGFVVIIGAFWIPIYLFLMQKRVYGQGWWMTSFKYWCVGTIYLVLLSLTIAIDLAIGLLRS